MPLMPETTSRSLLLLTALFAVIGLRANAFSQAAAESALTSTLSSSSAAKAGSALNHALDHSTRQLGNRIQRQTISPIQSGAQTTRIRGIQVKSQARQLKNSTATSQFAGSAYAGSVPANRGISIQGGEIRCAPAMAGSQNSPKTMASPGAADCQNQTAAAKNAVEDEYKSYVTLPRPK